MDSHSVRPITVGTKDRNYNVSRNFMDAPVPGVTYGRRGDWLKIPDYALFRLFGHLNPVLHNLEYGSRGFDLLHFFNAASLGNTPWVSTFETSIPRWADTVAWGHRFGVKLLARDACRRLIAMCDAARADQFALLEAQPDLAEKVAAKVTVLHPPQAPLVDAPKAGPTDTIRMMIVGKDFFRKGGGEILRALDRVLEDGLPFHLTIVSTLEHGDYASKTTEADVAEAKRVIAKWPDQITYHYRLPNPEVLDLFRTSHVGLLPTWGETYGYSVLEAQAAGCPALTTDLRALPEINDDNCGWMIEMPKTRLRDGVLGTAAERAAFSRQLGEGIEARLREMAADPASIAAKGANAFKRLRAHHDPVTHATRLREIYDEALRPA